MRNALRFCGELCVMVLVCAMFYLATLLLWER